MDQPTLPFTGRSPRARHCGYLAARSAGARRPRLRDAYVQWLAQRGELGGTDHEAAAALGCPVSSVCSTRSAVRERIVDAGDRVGPYGERNTVWRLRRALAPAGEPRASDHEEAT
jgi:hypothetical protein